MVKGSGTPQLKDARQSAAVASSLASSGEGPDFSGPKPAQRVPWATGWASGAIGGREQGHFGRAVLLMERKTTSAITYHNIVARSALFGGTCGASHGAVLRELAGMLFRLYKRVESLSVRRNVLKVDSWALATANAVLLHARPADAGIRTCAGILPARVYNPLD